MSLLSACDELELHRVSRQKARKEYCCHECDRKIEVGETYRRDFSVEMGDAQTYIICYDCDHLIQKFFAAIPKDYRFELTFETGSLSDAIIQLRDEYGATVEGFQYPAAEVIQLNR